VEALREKFHSNQLAQSLTLSDPAVALRVQQLSGAYGHTILDPDRRNAEGLRLLTQQVSQQAHVLAYNDVFLLISGLAALGCVWVSIHHLRTRLRAREVATQQATAAAAAVAD
jgi:hypothetical protein